MQREDSRVKTEAEIGVMLPQTKMPGDTRSWLWRELGPGNNLILDFYSLNCKKKKKKIVILSHPVVVLGHSSPRKLI